MKLICGDCLKEMKKMPNESVDIIITSPPYNIGNMHSNHLKFGTYKGNNMKEEYYQEWQINVLNECYRILKKNGSMFYNHKVRIKNGKTIHPLEWLFKTKFILKQEITWDMGKSANCDKIRFFPFSERIYWLVKDSKTKIYNKLHLSDVWRVVPTNKRKNTRHIAVMPIEIVDNILDNIPYKNDLIVLDPFMGTGTTGLSAINHNMNFIGIELDKNYFNIAKERIENNKLSNNDNQLTIFNIGESNE